MLNMVLKSPGEIAPQQCDFGLGSLKINVNSNALPIHLPALSNASIFVPTAY